MPTKAAAKIDEALLAEVLRLELDRHNLRDLSTERRMAKVKKLNARVARAFAEGLTADMVQENLALGRPPHWLEGEHWVALED